MFSSWLSHVHRSRRDRIWLYVCVFVSVCGVFVRTSVIQLIAFLRHFECTCTWNINVQVHRIDVSFVVKYIVWAQPAPLIHCCCVNEAISYKTQISQKKLINSSSSSLGVSLAFYQPLLPIPLSSIYRLPYQSIPDGCPPGQLCTSKKKSWPRICVTYKRPDQINFQQTLATKCTILVRSVR